MRFSIILYFLLCASTFLIAQSAPAPTAPHIISEDDLKLGIYDAPAFQPAARNLTVGETASAKDGELSFLLGSDTSVRPRIRYTPSYYRLQAACRLHSDQEDFMAFLRATFNEELTAASGVARQE